MNANNDINLHVAVIGSPQATQDFAAVGTAVNKLEKGAEQAGKAGKELGEGLDQAASSGKKLAASKVWDSYKSGAAGAVSSTEALAKSLGNLRTISNASHLKGYNAEIDRLARLSGLSSSAMGGLVRQMDTVRRNRALDELRQTAELSTLQFARLQAGTGNLSGAMGTLGRGAASVGVAVAAVGAAVGFATKACFDAALQMDRLTKTYASITGSGMGATVQLGHLQDVSEKLGLEFVSTARAAKTFFAAGKGTTLAPEMNRIFEAVSTAGAALTMSTDDVQGAFLALGQMISKGKVQAEELRGQLGERLPGAFQLAAKAMGMTTAELDKFMADGKLTAEMLLPKLATALQNDFGVAAVNASQGIQGAINRLSTEWTLLKASFVDSEMAVSSINAVRGAVQGTGSALAVLSEYGGVIKRLAVGAGVAAGVAGISLALKTCLPLLSVFSTALGVNNALVFAGGLKTASSALAGFGAAILANPVATFAVAVGTLAAMVVYLGDELNEEKAILRTLNDAQKTAEEGARALAGAHKLSADELDNLIAKQREASSALQSVEDSVRERLFTQGYYGFDKLDTGNEHVIASLTMLGEALPTEELGHFEQALEEAKRAALQDGDWKKLQTELDKIERQSKAAGDYTGYLRGAIEQVRAASRDAITYNVRIKVTQDVEKGLLAAQFLKNTFGEDAQYMKGTSEDWRESRDADLAQKKAQFFSRVQDEFNKTTAGKARTLKEEIESYRVHLADPSHYGLNAEQVTQLQTVMTSARDELAKLGKKGGSGSSAINAYTADIERTRASVEALQAQLAAPADDTAARERIRIAKDYGQSMADIEKQAANYAEKNGIGQAQAEELKDAKLLEAQLKQNLALRDLEKGNAEVRLDFEKRYADMVGATSAGVIASINKQAAEYKKAGADQLRVAEWTQDQIQRASRKGLDGAQVALRDYAAEASNQAKAMNDSFSGLFRGLDQGFNTMWEQLLTSGKASFSDFKKLFTSFLADIAHMAFTRPIVVQIAGALSGVFGTAGMAGATGTAASGAGGGMGGLLGNIPFGSLLPNSWTSGLSGFLGAPLPGTQYMLAPTIYETGGVPLAGQMSSGFGFGSAMLYGGLGGLGYGLLGGALGLPQNKYTGFTSTAGGMLGAFGGSSLGAGLGASGAISGAMAGSAVFPVVGTVIGALAGGLLGGLFGRGDRRIPSTNSRLENASLLGTDWGAALNNNEWGAKMGRDQTAQIWGPLGDIATQTVAGFETFASALPKEYAAMTNEALQNARVTMGHDRNGANFKIRPGDNLESDMKRVGEEIQRALFASFQGAVEGIGLSGKLGLNMDLSSGAGIEKAVQGVTAWKDVESAIDATLKPVAALTAQTSAANSQMTAWIDSLRALGWQEHKLAEIEAQRAGYIEAITFQLRTQFDMEMTLREASLRGTGDLVSAQQSLWSDWQSIVANFGAGSDQAKRWQAYQAEALPKLAEELAKSQYQSQIDSLKQQAQAFRQVAGQLTALRSGLRTNARTSPFDLTQRSAEAGADFNATLAKAMAGDVTAAQQLSGLSSGYLELLKSGASTSADYEAQFFGVLSQLEAVEKLYGSQLTDADLGLEEQQKSNKTLSEILAEIEKLNAEMQNAVTSNAGALQDYLAGLLNGTIRTRATGGYTPPGLTLVGEEGPELVNFSRPGMVYTAGQSQTLLRNSWRSNSTGGTGGSSSEVVALRQEVYQLRRDLLLALDRIDRNTRRLSDTAEQWNDEGLPAGRDTTPFPLSTRGRA